MKKWIALNLLLLAAAALIGWQLRAKILDFNTENDVGKIVPVQNVKQRAVPEKAAPAIAAPQPYNPADFSVIADKNLFSDTRTKEEPVVATAPPEPPPLTQKPILVGIVIVDAQKTASIIEPVGGNVRSERTNRAQTKRIGDVYQGYTITDIASDHIVLESGTRKEVIPLYEGSKRSPGGKTPVLATRVVPFGGGAASGGTIISGSVGVSAARTVVPIGGAPASAPGQTVVVQPVPTSAGRGAQSSAQPAAKAPPAPAGSGTGTGAAPGTRIIKTPFGDIVRPAR